MQVTRIEFVSFYRLSQYGRPVDDTTVLNVNPFLLDNFHSPSALSAETNAIEVCSQSDGRLQKNPERTAEGIAQLVEASPAIMIINRRSLMARGERLTGLEYSAYSVGARISPINPADYIAGTEAARMYAKHAGICSEGDFAAAEKSGRLGAFGQRTLGHRHTRNQRLYLLAEVNALPS